MKGYLLDTNVVSELIKPRPNPGLAAWILSVDEEICFLSVLTTGEIRKGINLLPASARRSLLEVWLERELSARFSGRILAIDRGVADKWGQLTAEVSSKRKLLPVVDGLIAATALQHDLMLVTRNTNDIELTRVPVLNPWS